MAMLVPDVAERRKGRGDSSVLARGRDLPPATAEAAAPLEVPLSWFRWLALAVATVLVPVRHGGAPTLIAGAAVLAYCIARERWPIGFDRVGARPNLALVLEVVLGVVAVEATGFGHSPFLVFLGVGALAAAFTGGIRGALALCAVAAGALVLPGALPASATRLGTAGAQLALALVLAGVAGALIRYVLEDAWDTSAGLGARIRHLSQVNDLVYDLHAATTNQRTPLDVEGVVGWVTRRLDEAFAADVTAVLLRDPATGCWRQAGGSEAWSGPKRHDELPAALAAAMADNGPVSFENPTGALSFRTRWAMYCALRARGEVLGALAVESRVHRTTRARDRRLMGEMARASALALDNARWFDRIRTLGGAEERSRLARELHDHVGQSMVYLGFELDRLAELNEGRAVQGDLRGLRADVGELVRDLRDALVDLRSDVSDTLGVDAVLASFVERVNARGVVKVSLVTDVSTRLPLSVEREFSRVAREAVLNAERHARASSVSVHWRCREEGALLEVRDDGVGMDGGWARMGSFGLRGMCERADAVRAELEVTSRRGEGTVVRMRKAGG